MASSAYLLLGPENGVKQEKIDQIVASITKRVGTKPEIHRFFAFDADDEDLFATLNNNSFFSDHRLVILNNIEALPAQTANAIASYLSHPSENSTLVMTSDETYVKLSQITKKIPKENSIVFWEMFDNQKDEWIREFFRRQGITITSDAIDSLLSLIDNNTSEMKTICSQLALFWQTDKCQKPIDADAVETYVEHTKDEDGYTLFPAMAKRDLKQSLRILYAILDSGDSSTSFALYAQLLWQFRRLFSIARLFQETGNEATAFGGASVLGSSSPVRNFREKSTYRTGIQNYSVGQLKTVLMALGDADIPIKSAGDFSRLEWERLIFAIVVENGVFPEEAVFLTT